MMIKKTINLFLILLLSQICFSQNNWNYFGADLLSFRENAEWIKKNNIETIYEFDYLQSDNGRLHIIDKYSFDSNGLLKSVYQSPPYFYVNWEVNDSMEFAAFRKYHYDKIDSLYRQTIIFYLRHENGLIDSLTRRIQYISVDKVHHSKLPDNEELIFDYDSKGNCISFTQISELFGKPDTLITKLIYKKGLLTEAKQENKVQHFWGLNSAKYYYNKKKQMTKMVVLGNPEEITYKYYYDKNNFIIKKEMYFEDRPAGYSEYIYICK